MSGTSNHDRVIEICKGIVDRRVDIDWKCKETFMTHRDTHEHENNKVFSYQRVKEESMVHNLKWTPIKN